MTATNLQASLRFDALMDVKRKLSQQLAEAKGKSGNTSNMLTDKIVEAIGRLPGYSTTVLQELSAVDPMRLIGILFDGTCDETLLREYIMYSPAERAIVGLRQAFGLESLLTEDAEQRAVFSAAMNIWHAGHVIKVKRDGAIAATIAVNVTSEIAEVIASNAHREQDIIDFIKDRNLTAAEIDAGHLRECLAGTAALSMGTL